MRSRTLLPFVSLLAGSLGVAVATVAGCSSSSGTPATHPGACDGAACEDTGVSAEAGGGGDAGADAFEASPGEHDGAAPDALYGCATMGSFGWACTATTTGPDTTDCTDPNYPDCFVGGQGAWCTKTCTGNTDCTNGVEDAGCAPTSCNTKGYCK